MNKTAITLYFLLLCLSVQAQHNEYIHYLSEYIRYPSTSGNEKEAGLYLLNVAKEKGLETKILTDNKSAFNFIASLYPISENKPNYVFLNHIDVVDPGDQEKWKYPPFSGFIDDDAVWGRGAIDNKGMAIAQLAALVDFSKSYKNFELPFNVTLLAVSGEESGSTGARTIARDWLDSLNIKFILGEGGSGVKNIIPSDPERALFGISTSEKSRIVLELELVLNTLGHASVPPNEYALKEMIQALSRITSDKRILIFNKTNKKSLRQLGRVEGGIKGFVLRHNGFPLFRPLIKAQIKKDPMIAAFFSNTISITDFSSIESDDNQFPETVSVILDCRLLPNTNVERFINCIHKKLKDERIQVRVKEAVISPGRTYDSELFHILSESLESVFPKAANIEIIFPATSDNSIFRSKGITVFGLFPGVFSEKELENVHNIDEYISKDVLLNSMEVYKTFLLKLAKSHNGQVEISRRSTSGK